VKTISCASGLQFYTAACVLGIAFDAASFSQDRQHDSSEMRSGRTISDQAIIDKVEDELIADQGVAAARIDVESLEGIVTPSGTAEHVLAKDRAVRIAETVRGVRSVIDRVEVDVSRARSDLAVKKDIQSALLADSATDSYEIGVTVKNGIAVLSGAVDSYRELQLAETVAKGVRGVRRVATDIDVRYKYERPDGEIREEIERSLDWDIRTSDDFIHVRVDDGNVTLRGVVGSAADRRAARIASWVAGVRGVNAERLLVNPAMGDDMLRGRRYVVRSEQEIRRAVQDALLRDPRVVPFDLGVDVAGSVVTLRGEVDSLSAKQAAERDALNTVGVTAVANRLVVRPEMTLGDESLELKILDAIQRDPYLERANTRVEVHNGKAYLFGEVNSQFEKNRATLAASTVQGLFAVSNRQQIRDRRDDKREPRVAGPYVDGFADTPALHERRLDRRSEVTSDAAIERQIRDDLLLSVFVDAGEVSVRADGGVVKLEGVVDTWSERSVAEKLAYAAGATLVENDLTVKPEQAAEGDASDGKDERFTARRDGRRGRDAPDGRAGRSEQNSQR
jgi:osmotically-inducible protein OsmY